MEPLQICKHLAGRVLACAFSALALVAGSNIAVQALHAQDQGDSQEAAQPARAIRLSYVDGNVQLTQAGQTVAELAVINTPLLQGMTLSTADNGRAEIQFEDGSVARIAPNSALTLTTLTGSGSSAEADITLQRGEAYFEFQANNQVGSMRVQFGDSIITCTGFTVLRVQYDTPPGALAVFTGNAHLERGNSIFLDLHGGQSLAFNGNSASSYDLTESIASDSWDSWNSDRDEVLNAELASQTGATSDLAKGENSNPAWGELDSNGSWYNVPDQGYVWSPYEAANPGFDPYGYGSWVWMPSYGYAWASGYTWGYLPFSCGSWNYYNSFGWGWAPGFGGCSPWWRHGYYTGVSIGFAPGWYRPIRRPEPPRARVWPGHPIPMIAVRRNQPGFGNALPPRDRNTPVNIGGATVVGMHPMPGRTTPRSGAIVRGTAGISTGGGFNNRPSFPTPREAYNPSSQRGMPPIPANPAANQPGRSGDQQRNSVFPASPQPGRVYEPNRGNVGPANPAIPSAPTPAPRPYTPAPAPTTPPPVRSGPTPGGGFHPSPSPNPGGGGSMRTGPAPGTIRANPAPGPSPGPSGGAPRGGGSPGGGNPGGGNHGAGPGGHH